MNPGRRTERVSVSRMGVKGGERCRDLVAVESPLDIRLSFEEAGAYVEQAVSVTMRTPGDDFELAAGFLFNEGIIWGSDDIAHIRYCCSGGEGQDRYDRVGTMRDSRSRDGDGQDPAGTEEGQDDPYGAATVVLRPGVRPDLGAAVRRFVTAASCGVCGKASTEALRFPEHAPFPTDRPTIPRRTILSFPDALKRGQPIFAKTGGVHGAALIDPDGGVLSAREDIGRHNAVDKLVGERLLSRKWPIGDCFLALSGRVGYEIIQKALAAGIPFVAGIGAPSSLAVSLAAEHGMTLVGFVRQEGFNVYCGDQRIA